jgi:hypothetical protein
VLRPAGFGGSRVSAAFGRRSAGRDGALTGGRKRRGARGETGRPSGTWDLKETWREPERYKRAATKGLPARKAYAEQTIRERPGDFSLLWGHDARGPVGKVTALAVVSWAPARSLQDYFQVHSALPGALRLTGRLEKGRLVFRGNDSRTGEKTSVRLVLEDLSTNGWTQVFEEQPEAVGWNAS